MSVFKRLDLPYFYHFLKARNYFAYVCVTPNRKPENMHRTILLIAILMLGNRLQAETEDSSDLPEFRRIEALMNISNTLSRFAGNTPRQSVIEEPFLLGLKISSRNKNSALRIGINFAYSSNEENDVSGTTRTSQISSWAPLIGYEWRRNLGSGFEFYGGVDARYFIDINNTSTISFLSSGTSQTHFRNRLSGFGAGPFCGFTFAITPRVLLLTEANLYVNFVNSTRQFSADGGKFDTFEDKNATNFSPTAPSSLCIQFRF